jgi:hypothetical protein
MYFSDGVPVRTARRGFTEPRSGLLASCVVVPPLIRSGKRTLTSRDGPEDVVVRGTSANRYAPLHIGLRDEGVAA